MSEGFIFNCLNAASILTKISFEYP